MFHDKMKQQQHCNNNFDHYCAARILKHKIILFMAIVQLHSKILIILNHNTNIDIIIDYQHDDCGDH